MNLVLFGNRPDNNNIIPPIIMCRISNSEIHFGKILGFQIFQLDLKYRQMQEIVPKRL